MSFGHVTLTFSLSNLEAHSLHCNGNFPFLVSPVSLEGYCPVHHLSLSHLQQDVPAAVHPASSGARLCNDQRHGLGHQVHIGEGVAEGGSAAGHGLVRAAPSHAHPELQGDCHQEVNAGVPAWPWPGRPWCGGGGWSGSHKGEWNKYDLIKIHARTVKTELDDIVLFVTA